MYKTIKIGPETKWSNLKQILDRTLVCCKIQRWLEVRDERSIKLRDSWFFAKAV